MPLVDPVVVATLRAALGLLFLGAARHKLRDLAAFRATLAQYDLLPRAATHVAAIALVAAESATAIGLLAAAAAVVVVGIAGAEAPVRIAGAERDAHAATWEAAAAALASVLLAVYTAAIAAGLARGRRGIDCGCAGPALQQPLGGGLVARNLLLLGAALLCLGPMGSRPLVWLDAFTVLAAVGVLATWYSALERLMAVAPVVARARARA